MNEGSNETMADVAGGAMAGSSGDGMDEALATMLDGNAAAGMLHDVFGSDVTTIPAECAHCGNVAEIATTHAWMEGPGLVLRCSVCGEVVLRIVETPDARYVDARGAAYIRLARQP